MDIRNETQQRTVADGKSAPMEDNLIALSLDLHDEPTTAPPLASLERRRRELFLNLQKRSPYHPRSQANPALASNT
jgi:hypothetical protein